MEGCFVTGQASYPLKFNPHYLLDFDFCIVQKYLNSDYLFRVCHIHYAFIVTNNVLDTYRQLYFINCMHQKAFITFFVKPLLMRKVTENRQDIIHDDTKCKLVEFDEFGNFRCYTTSERRSLHSDYWFQKPQSWKQWNGIALGRIGEKTIFLPNRDIGGFGHKLFVLKFYLIRWLFFLNHLVLMNL